MGSIPSPGAMDEDIRPLLKEGLNYVFLETNNEGFISNVSSMLKSLNGISIEGTKEKPIEVEREIALDLVSRRSKK